MSALAPKSDPKVTDLLLGDHDRVEPSLAHVGAETAKLADGIPDALELFRVLLHQEPRAVVAASFFVTDQRQDYVPGRSESFGLGP